MDTPSVETAVVQLANRTLYSVVPPPSSVWSIAVAQFSHVIAGSTETAFAAMHGAISWADYAIGFLLPAVVGNSIGGVVFVAMLNHAQVKAEI